MKLLLELSYIGTNYCGFQVQQNGISVQKTLQQASEALFSRTCMITGCSRTDSGVHARKYFCTVDGPDCDGSDYGRIPCDRIPEVLNTKLPLDIAIRSAAIVPDDFHPRYSARAKEYRYFILNSRVRDPFSEGLVYRILQPLDDNKMKNAAKYFEGKHDFAAFMSAGSDITDTIRTISACHVDREAERITITVAGDGFLYNMVRIIVGTLIDISYGRIEPDEIGNIISSRNRKNAGFTAPPQGLFLWDVLYS